jgi:trehalose utilization protein
MKRDPAFSGAVSTPLVRYRAPHQENPMATKVTIWNEYRHEKKNAKVAEIYPNGMHEAIANHLRKDSTLSVSTATLDESEHGLTESRVNETDVMVWWGHIAHDEVKDEIVKRVHQRVLAGMGLVVLHSGHFSKLFKSLMGTSCDLKWREADDAETLWVTRPSHPILQGVDDHFTLPGEEMYGEFFDIPEPDETILISSFTGGEVFRSGITYTRGAGRIFYFRPGHETYPTYHDKNVLKIIQNAVHWVKPTLPIKALSFGERKAGWMKVGK